MENNSTTPVVFLKEFVQVSFRPITDDDERNAYIRECVGRHLTQAISGDPAWQNHLKRRSALEYITALTLGTRGDHKNTFVAHEKIVCYRGDEGDVYETRVVVPWLLPEEAGIIEMYVEWALCGLIVIDTEAT